MANFVMGAVVFAAGVLCGWLLRDRVKPQVVEVAAGELPAPVSPHARAKQERRIKVPVGQSSAEINKN
jgi:hypothetical protein